MGWSVKPEGPLKDWNPCKFNCESFAVEAAHAIEKRALVDTLMHNAAELTKEYLSTDVAGGMANVAGVLLYSENYVGIPCAVVLFFQCIGRDTTWGFHVVLCCFIKCFTHLGQEEASHILDSRMAKRLRMLVQWFSLG